MQSVPGPPLARMTELEENEPLQRLIQSLIRGPSRYSSTRTKNRYSQRVIIMLIVKECLAVDVPAKAQKCVQGS